MGEQELKDGVDWAGYIKTLPAQGHHQCVHFKSEDNTCGIYDRRPFECALYPFIVSQHGEAVSVYMHLACPYIQDKEVSPELAQYAQYLKEFFALDTTKTFLANNRQLLHDYSSSEVELKFVFNIEV